MSSLDRLQPWRYALLALLLAILGVFLLWPIVMTVCGAFVSPSGGWTLRYFFAPDIGVLRDPLYLAGLGNSLVIAVCTTTLCLLLSLPLALLAGRYDFRGKPLLTALVLVPLVLPPFVGAIGLRAILGRGGALNALLSELHLVNLHPGAGGGGFDFLGSGLFGSRLLGVVLIEALHLYPIVYLNVVAALSNIDPAMDEAAENLGAGRPDSPSLRITLPLILPGVFAGCTIAFIWSFTELGTPLMLNYYKVTAVQVFWGLNEVQANPRPFALVVVMLLAALAIYAVSKATFGRRAAAMQSKGTVAAQLRPLHGWRAAAAAACFLGLTGLAVLPHLGLVLNSFSVDGAWYHSILPTRWTASHYADALTHPLAASSIRNSLMYASGAMVLCLFLGLAIAYLTVRARIRGGLLLDSLAMLPLAVPGLVMAFGYVAISVTWPFGTGHPLSGWLDVVGANPNPVLLLIVAYAVRRLPYVVRSAAAGLEQTPVQLEEAALNLGASTFRTMRSIVIPLIAANLIAGGILAFSFAMLEVSDSLILAQKEQHFPITKAIFEFFNRLGDGQYIASAMGVWGMALLAVTLVGAALLMGKRLGAIFRA